jgi:hypothetical protein
VQVETAGDPLARTYWRWRWSWNPLEIYAPASSAVGILQITDGTFVEASRLCIHDHAVAREGAWYDPRACWFNALYFRTVPGHSIEMTAALLHEAIAEALAGRGATPAQRHRVAALVHLCGRGRAPAFAQRGFRALPGERCGAHDLDRYLDRVEALAQAFERLPGPAPEVPRGLASPRAACVGACRSQYARGVSQPQETGRHGPVAPASQQWRAAPLVSKNSTRSARPSVSSTA